MITLSNGRLKVNYFQAAPACLAHPENYGLQDN